MRQNRIIAALIALCLAASIPLVSLGSAQATSFQATEQAKTKVTIKFAANGAKSFKLYGKVKPAAKNKTAKLLRSGSADGPFRKAGTTKTDKRGNYSFNGLKKEGFYAVKIGKAVSKAIQVCKGGC